MKYYLTITAGRGPIECQWVVAQVLKEMKAETEESALRLIEIGRTAGDLSGTIQSVVVMIEGDDRCEFAKQWCGAIQWIEKSRYRKHHRRKNWFVGVHRESVANQQSKTQDFHIESMRSGGPGGQHVNKVSTAIRATCRRTGASVVVSEQRSQLQNKKIAIERLKSKIEKIEMKKMALLAEKRWEQMIGLERGNPVRVFRRDRIKKESKKKFRDQRKRQKQNIRED